MNDLDRNTRTLIVCFVVVLGALVPLRFVEAGQMMVARQSQILGEVAPLGIELEPVERVSPARLEAPYDRIDGVLGEGGVDCIDVSQATVLIDRITEELVEGTYSQAQVREILEVVEGIEERVCE